MEARYLGITIHYEGIIKKNNEEKLISFIENSARNNGWRLDSKLINLIMVTPHQDCESIIISYDEALGFSGIVKTGFAPSEVHKQIVKLFYEIKPMLKKLIIEDESGYWLEYIDKASNRSFEELTHFPTIYEKDLIASELLQLSPYATDCDRDFWETTPNYVEPFMDVLSVRNRMGYDLSNKPYVLTASEIGEQLVSEGFHVNAEVWENEIFYFINLATLWAWKRSNVMNATKMRRNKCKAFSWALARGCHGFEGGFLDQTHRRAHIAIDILEQKEGTLSQIKSLEVLYSLFDFCGLKREDNS